MGASFSRDLSLTPNSIQREVNSITVPATLEGTAHSTLLPKQLEGNVSVLAPSQCVFTRGYSPLCVPVLAPPITVAPWPYYSCVWPSTHCILPAIAPILLHRVNI